MNLGPHEQSMKIAVLVLSGLLALCVVSIVQAQIALRSATEQLRRDTEAFTRYDETLDISRHALERAAVAVAVCK